MSYDPQANNETLKRHNELRQKHGVPPLTLDPHLAEMAQAYAEKLARANNMQHASPKERENAGENLAMMGGMALTGVASTDMWYDEIKDYDFNKPGFNMNTGHFTQVVWKGSQKFGFGLAQNGSSYYGVGRYFPAGNMMGAFPENVPPPGSQPSKNTNQPSNNNKENKTKQQKQPAKGGEKGKKVNLSEDEKEAMTTAFENYVDENGNVSVEDIADVLRASGQNPKKERIDEVISKVDVNQDGVVSFEEFYELIFLEMHESSNDMVNNLRAAFKEFDTNGDGYIDREELFDALTTMGEKMTDEEVDELMQIGDVDGDGRLDVDEYVRMFCYH